MRRLEVCRRHTALFGDFVSEPFAAELAFKRTFGAHELVKDAILEPYIKYDIIITLGSLAPFSLNNFLSPERMGSDFRLCSTNGEFCVCIA